MELPSDVAAVERRMAVIEGAAPASPAAPSPSHSDPDPAAFRALIQRDAAAWKVDPNLLEAIASEESGFDPMATSAAGAAGIMQLMPATAASLGVTDRYDPGQSIFGGARYVRGLLDRFHNNVRLAVAAYNAGPGAVEKYDDVPHYGETQAYVRNVLAAYKKYGERGAP